MLAWLALEGPTTRARLAALLWPGSDGETARNALRQRLFQLRRLTGFELATGQATLTLNERLTHDLSEADSLLGEADIESIAAGEFAHWLHAQRERRRQRRQLAVAARADAAEQAADWGGALTLSRELLTTEPVSEAAHRRLMRVHYLSGDRAAALLAFDQCERMLKDEVGARPSVETLALLATIEAAAPPAPAVDRAGPLPASVQRPPRLIGRDRELAELLRGMQAGQVVAVTGEAGMGKSRLLQTLLAARTGLVYSAGRPGDAGVPFSTLARLLRAVLLRAAESSGHDPADTAVPRAEIARVLPEFDPGGSRRVAKATAWRCSAHCATCWRLSRGSTGSCSTTCISPTLPVSR